MKTKPQPLLISTRQVCKLLGCSRTIIETLRLEGKLQPIKLTSSQNAKVYFLREDVERLVEERAEESKRKEEARRRRHEKTKQKIERVRMNEA